MGQHSWAEGPRIYNLFPLLAGPIPRWGTHIERARQMDLNWIFINPIQQSGHSGSLYSIKDYYAIDTRMLEPAGGPAEEQVRAMVAMVRGAGIGLMMDLVINHTAFDSPLVREHPEWYRRGPDGKPMHPGTQDGDRRRKRDGRSPVSRSGLARYGRCYDAPCDSDFGAAGKVKRGRSRWGRSARA